MIPYKRNAGQQFSISVGCRPLFPPYIFKMVRSILNQCLTGLSTGTSCTVQKDSFFFFIDKLFLLSNYLKSSVDRLKIWHLVFSLRLSLSALLLSSYLIPLLHRADLGYQCGCFSFGGPLSTVCCVVSLPTYDLLCFFLIPC
jgi:hypothetical protein